MSDDEMPELEDLSEQLNEIRKARGIDEKNIPKDIKIGVINENKNSNNNNKVNIPISTSPPPQTKNQTQQPQPQTQQKPKENKDNKRDEDNFGFGLFKRGFLKRHNFSEDDNKDKNKKEKEKEIKKETKATTTTKKDEPVDLTHIKSNPGTTTKTNVLNNFNKDLKSSQDATKINPNLLNNLAYNKQQWLNQELLMKIAQNPNLMRCFMDPRFSTVIQELQTNPQECLKKYGNNPEFSNFIKDFSALMGDHFNNLAKNPLQGNPNYTNPEVQEIINDPKIKPILERLQKEGKIDMNEIMRDPYVSSKFKVLIDKKILNIQKMD